MAHQRPPISTPSIPYDPTLRSPCLNTVAVVPLLSSRNRKSKSNKNGTNATSTTTHSQRSLETLFSSLLPYANPVSTTSFTSSHQQQTTTEKNGSGTNVFLPDDGSKMITPKSQTQYYASSKQCKELSLIIPNSQLTRPGEWRYDTTPLKHHDWSDGFQRMVIFDGRDDARGSALGHERLAAFNTPNAEPSKATTDGKEESKNSHTSDDDKNNDDKAKIVNAEKSRYGDFLDLYPHRGISAVIGVLNVNDCDSAEDLQEAKDELDMWKKRYTPALYGNGDGQKHYVRPTTRNERGKKKESNDNSDDDDDDSAEDLNPMDPVNFVTQRMFVFDSFEESVMSEKKLNLGTLQRMGSGELVAFPPVENMEMHINIVVYDLAVALFMSLETRIKVLGKMNVPEKDKGMGISTVAGIVGPGNSLNDAISTNDNDKSRQETTKTDGSSSPQRPASIGRNASTGKKKPGFNLKAIAVSAVKALNKPNLAIEPEVVLPSDDHYLSTPIDSEVKNLTGKDIEYIIKRNDARKEKYAADLAMLAGSPMDAYERYTRAASLTSSHDPLWHAASLEGLASSFVAMSDVGGHGADEYLEKNFQFPVKIMIAALRDSGNNIENFDEKESKIDKSKTTMPIAVLSLLEDACNIMSHHVALSSIHAELLLKMAWYVSELEGLHNRCRWGSGLFNKDVYDEDGIGPTHSDEQSSRFELTSISKLDIDNLKEKGVLDSILSKSTVRQTLKFTGFLHRAVSIGGLGAMTRAFIASRCTKLCLKGVKIPEWTSDVSRDSFQRFTLPRKAAFFTIVAAESMSLSRRKDAQKRALSFWEAARRLYSHEGNGHDSNKSYGWASLRVSILHALSQEEGTKSAELALEQLLMLLTEITPDKKTSAVLEEIDANDDGFVDRDIERIESGISEYSDIMSMSTNSRKEILRKPMPARSPLVFSQVIPPAMLKQSEWVSEDTVPLLQLPLIEQSAMFNLAKDNAVSTAILNSLFVNKSSRTFISLNCVVSSMRYEVTAGAQKYCISHLAKCRQAIQTFSDNTHHLNQEVRQQSQTLSYLSPLDVVSAEIVKSESHMLLDRTKAAGFAAKDTGSMATFFNPYANKKKDEPLGKNLITVVAQGEERTIKMVLSNLLSFPLTIPSCQLDFEKSNDMEIEAPPLSFTIPSKCKRFTVQFPFIVIGVKKKTNAVVSEDEKVSISDNVEVVGLRIQYLNRSISIPFEKNYVQVENISMRQLPIPASIYPRRNLKKTSDQLSVKLETVPAQPNLLVSFSTSPIPLEDATMVPVHLSEGEIYSIPPFRLENDFGPSGLGRMERLQIVGVGLPGLPEEILFDTDELAKALEEEQDDFTDTDEETDFEELMESDGLPPLKMKCLAEGLSLESINDTNKSLGEGSIVKFQIAATHDMGNQLKNGGNVRIRFRYRGPSSTPGIENWRKREIALQIVRVKGPRISSLTLRSDLSWGSAYTDLCRSLAHQKQDLDTVKHFDSTRIIRVTSSATNFDGENDELTVVENADDDTGDCILHRVGSGKGGAFVSGDNIVVLMAVANETNTTIVLSNRIGVVGGFESSPMPTVRVTSGVSVKIPVVIPRIDCLDDGGDVTDIAAELIARTGLHWKSEIGETEDSANKQIRQGRVRIPSRCLREIIEEHKSFATRICKPPITVSINIGNDTNTDTVLRPGAPLDTTVNANIQDWVPAVTLNTCAMTLEFCCARKDSGRDDSTFKEKNDNCYIWCGQIRKNFKAYDEHIQHSARIVFLRPGEYVVSACVKICSKNNAAEEIWWAPRAKTVIVERFEDSQ